MTDEELGRKWAEWHGKRPYHHGGKCWFLATDSIIGDYCELPKCLAYTDPIDGEFESESRAFAALGSALRQLVTFADGVREVMG